MCATSLEILYAVLYETGERSTLGNYIIGTLLPQLPTDQNLISYCSTHENLWPVYYGRCAPHSSMRNLISSSKDMETISATPKQTEGYQGAQMLSVSYLLNASSHICCFRLDLFFF